MASIALMTPWRGAVVRPQKSCRTGPSNSVTDRGWVAYHLSEHHAPRPSRELQRDEFMTRQTAPATLSWRMPQIPCDPADPYDLARFVRGQEHAYELALSEIRSGRKRSHWMWYIFPQFDGLGFSATSKRYAIRSAAEAEAYLSHPILGPRLLEIAEAAAAIEGRSAFEVFGSPDDMKLRSCATLFAKVSPAGSVFERLLARYFGGKPDGETLRLLGQP